jgi:ATP-dependent DNA helicase RecG
MPARSKDGQKFIEEGALTMLFGKESETLEFKKTTGELKEAVISIASILNKSGKGELYFGIRNDGAVLGQQIGDATLRDVSKALSDNLKPQIFPIIDAVTIDNKRCVRVAFEANVPPYYAYGRAYIRVADEDKQMSPDELERYVLRKVELRKPWDDEVSDLSPSDIDAGLLKDFNERANQAKRIDFTYTNNDDVLKRLNLVQDGKVKNAAVALFRGFPLLEVQMAIFATTERLTFNDIHRSGGNTTHLVAAAEKYIRNNIRWRVVFDGSIQRNEIPEIPVDAVREAIINSFCHRDYKSSQNNEIVIYSNRIEIYNPGTFPDEFTPKDYIDGTGYSVKRNPLLAQLMYYVKDIESFGTGLKRIADECKTAGVKVEFEKHKLGFAVVFYRPDASFADSSDTGSVKVQSTNSKGNNCTLNCTLSEKAIIEYIESNPSATQSAIATAIGKSLRSVKTDMAHLQETGIIVREGSRRDGRWVVKTGEK